MLEDNITNKKFFRKLRPHSNTISGGRPPNIDITICRPSQVRRNSEGSPRLPPPININEISPIESITAEGRLSVDDQFDESANLNLLHSPIKQKVSRSRATSITSNIINELKESQTIQRVASKIKSRNSLEESSMSESIPSLVQTVPGTNGIHFANSKRNQDFHSLFKSIPEDDNLITDHGCALQKEILLQGRIYISETHVCFNANIFGWVTNLVIAFEEIIEIEKKSTAYFIPNAIQISTDNSKYFFASFLARDQVYETVVDIWRLSRPDLVPPREKDFDEFNSLSDSCGSGSFYDSDTEDSYSDETDDDFDTTRTKANEVKPKYPIVNREIKKLEPNRRRAASEAIRPLHQQIQPQEDKNLNITKPATTTNPTELQTHEKTECDCGLNGEHYPTTVMDQVYDGTMDKFYDLLFKSNFIEKFLIENQKTTELVMNSWKKGEGKAVLVREFTYIKPLNGAIGPKSAKCYITDEVLHQDTQKFVTVLTTTSTPDVPSGGSFNCKTKTCLTWAGKGKVRILVTVLVDFTKSSWLKSAIEKASIDGQQSYYKDLDGALQVYFRQHPDEFGGVKATHDKSKTSKKSKRRERKPETKTDSIPNSATSESHPSSVHQVLGSISNLIADAIVYIIKLISSPTASHLTVLCLILMVVINFFIAKRMSFVEQRLIELSKPPQEGFFGISQSHSDIHHVEQVENDKDLWDWLSHLDYKQLDALTEKIKLTTDSDEHKVAWNNALKITKMTKDKLDKHMLELGYMIQKAERDLDDITKTVSSQKKIEKEG